MMTISVMGFLTGSTFGFGSVSVGNPASQTFTIQNTRAATLNISSATISGVDSSLFTITAAPAVTVGAGLTTTFTVQFLPTTTGAKSALITIVSDDPDTGNYVVNLTGIGATIPNINITGLLTGSTFGFGSVTIYAPTSQSFTIQNTGNAPLNISSSTVNGTDSSMFIVTTAPAASVAASLSTTFTVKFLPTSTGAKSALIVIASDDPDTGSYVINFTGTATSPTSCGTSCKIFATNTRSDGNLGGISGADNNCNTDINKPLGTTIYKALLVLGTTRRACSTNGCSGGVTEHIDWVMRPSTSYYQSNGTVLIATTVATAGIWPTPLSLANVINTTGNGAWTGLSMTNGWTQSTSGTCGSWNSSSGSSTVGTGGQTGNSALESGYTCSATGVVGLYCVEQ